jgi:hypothetical protein
MSRCGWSSMSAFTRTSRCGRGSVEGGDFAERSSVGVIDPGTQLRSRAQPKRIMV